MSDELASMFFETSDLSRMSSDLRDVSCSCILMVFCVA